MSSNNIEYSLLSQQGKPAPSYNDYNNTNNDWIHNQRNYIGFNQHYPKGSKSFTICTVVGELQVN